jgi:hypothetical protein
MAKQRPEQGVEYAADVNAEYRSHNHLEATRSLAKAWGITEDRAADCLADPVEFRSELRSRPLTAAVARRQLEARRYPPG